MELAYAGQIPYLRECIDTEPIQTDDCKSIYCQDVHILTTQSIRPWCQLQAEILHPQVASVMSADQRQCRMDL